MNPQIVAMAVSRELGLLATAKCEAIVTPLLRPLPIMVSVEIIYRDQKRGYQWGMCRTGDTEEEVASEAISAFRDWMADLDKKVAA